MAYDPGVSYQGGQMFNQALQSAGNSIASGMQGYAQRKRSEAELIPALDAQAQAFAKAGHMTQEELDKFSTMGLNQKKGMIGGKNAEITMGLQQQQQQMAQQRMQMEETRLQMGVQGLNMKQADMEARNAPFAPSATDIPGVPGMKAVTTSRGQVQLVPIGGAAQPAPPQQYKLPDGASVIDLGNGKRVVQHAPAPPKPMDPFTATVMQGYTESLAKINAEMLSQQNLKNAGNNRTGPDWLPIGSTRDDQLAELAAKKAGLEAKLAAINNASPLPSAAPAQPAPAGGASPAAAPVEGKVYVDAAGNQARWVNGQWQPL